VRKIEAVALVIMFAASLLNVLVNPVSSATVDSWATKTPMHEARGGLGVAVVNGKIYAIGGSTRAGSPEQYTGGFVGTNEEYDPETDTWTLKRPMPTPRAYFRVEVVNGKIYCIGGLTTDHAVPTCAFEVYDPSTDTWKRLSSCPTFREDFITVVYNNKIFVIGGIVGRDLQAESRGTYTGITEVYDPTLDRWQTKAPMPTFRYPEACDVINGKIYVISGSTTYYESVSITAAYDEAANTWTKMASMPFVKHGSSAVLNGKIYFVGGSNEGEDYVSRLQIFDPETDNWTEGARPPNAVTVPDFAVAVKGEVSPRRIYVSGGGINIYDPENNAWTFAGKLPTSRTYIGFAVLEEKIYAIGGQTMIFPNDLFSPPYPTITTYATNEVYTPANYGTPDPYYLLEITPPVVDVLSPMNQTYYGPNVSLTFSLDKQVKWIGYSLDGDQNVTVFGNTTIANIDNGFHSLTVYAEDSFGNLGASAKMTFTTADRFPTELVISSVIAAAAVGLGLLVYLKKRQKTKNV